MCLLPGYLKAVWPEFFGSVFGRFSAKLGPQTPLERRGSSCSAGCTKNQPGRPSLRPFRGAKKFRPDCLQVPNGLTETVRNGRYHSEKFALHAVAQMPSTATHDNACCQEASGVVWRSASAVNNLTPVLGWRFIPTRGPDIPGTWVWPGPGYNQNAGIPGTEV